MQWFGLVIGAASFLIIGVFHPIVIQCEHHFSEKIWPAFLLGGLVACCASLFVGNAVISAVLAVLGFAMLWSIGELKHQAKRVEKGWFPKNPKRGADSARSRP